MTQSTFDEDELFAEATEEMRADIEEALSRVDEQLPAEDDLPWGIINPLRSAGLIYTDSQGVNHNQDDALFQYIRSEDPTVANLLESYLMTLRI